MMLTECLRFMLPHLRIAKYSERASTTFLLQLQLKKEISQKAGNQVAIKQFFRAVPQMMI